VHVCPAREFCLRGEVATLCGEVGVVGHDHSAADGGDHRVSVEREAADVTDGADLRFADTSTERFGRIFDDQNPVSVAKVEQRLHVGRDPKNVDDLDDRGSGLLSFTSPVTCSCNRSLSTSQGSGTGVPTASTDDTYPELMHSARSVASLLAKTGWQSGIGVIDGNRRLG
jgi:hypothetical protein